MRVAASILIVLLLVGCKVGTAALDNKSTAASSPVDAKNGSETSSRFESLVSPRAEPSLADEVYERDENCAADILATMKVMNAAGSQASSDPKVVNLAADYLIKAQHSGESVGFTTERVRREVMSRAEATYEAVNRDIRPNGKSATLDAADDRLSKCMNR